MKHKTLSFLLAVLMSMVASVASAEDFAVDGIYYSITSYTEPYTVAVTYRGSSYGSYSNEYSGSVTIPKSVTYSGKTYSVTKIGQCAFDRCTELTSVTIPNSVTEIGNLAFQSCWGLTSITIPNSVTSIGRAAFYSCTGLTSITIPNSVTSIDQNAFYYCTGLTSVHITDLAAWCRISFFSDDDSNPLDYAHHLYLNGEEIKDLVIPESMTSIGAYAFSGCTGLTSVTIPNSVTSIGYRAFNNCTGLTSAVIGNGVTSIGNNAFYNCTGLISVHITDLAAWCGISFSSNPLWYAHHLYMNGEEIKDLVIPESVTSIGGEAFSGCTGLTSVEIPNSVTSIGGSAFYGCTGLTSVTIPNSVTSIGVLTFYGCTGLTSVTIGNSVTSIGGEAFNGCTGLESITVASGNTVYDSRDNCNAIIKTASNTLIGGCKNTIIPNSVTSIDQWAFESCKGLTSVTIPNSVTEIGNYAFNSCWGLEKLTIADGEGTLSLGYNTYASSGTGKGLFYDCPLKTVYLGRNLSYGTSYSDGYSPFHGKRSLTSVTIGNSVTSIGGYAFNCCTGLTSVTIPNSVTDVGYYAFSGCTSLNSIDINSTKIGMSMFSGCTGLTSVTIGNSVTSIGYDVFKGCTGLIELTLGSGLQSIGEKAFADSKIRQLLVKSITPPSAPLDVFSEQTLLRTTLYVPVGAVDDYAYSDGWYKFNTIRESAVTKGKVSNEYAYTLMNVNTFDYAVYDAVNDRVKMVSVSNVDETNPKHCWQTVEMYGRKYLYNIGAKKFAVPGTGEAGLSMSSDVSSISMRTGADGIVLGDNTEQQWALVVDTKVDAYVGLADDIITGIESLTPALSQGEGEQGVYDLSGRKINVNVNVNVNNSKFEIQNSKLRKGIYIVNGKKLLKR